MELEVGVRIVLYLQVKQIALRVAAFLRIRVNSLISPEVAVVMVKEVKAELPLLRVNYATTEEVCPPKHLLEEA